MEDWSRQKCNEKCRHYQTKEERNFCYFDDDAVEVKHDDKCRLNLIDGEFFDSHPELQHKHEEAENPFKSYQ